MSTKKPSPKAEKVWAYLGKNKTATPAQVAKATGVSYGYAYKLMQNISSIRENGSVGTTMRAEEAKSTAKKPLTSGVNSDGFFSRSDS